MMLKKYKQSGKPLSANQMKEIKGGAASNEAMPVYCRYDWDCWPACNGNNPIGYYCIDMNCQAQSCEPA